MKKNIKVGIIGAGIQGISNALFLQKKGFDVTIFDRDNPGSHAASYGNAGHFSPYASVPLNRPDILADIPAMLLSSSGPPSEGSSFKLSSISSLILAYGPILTAKWSKNLWRLLITLASGFNLRFS